MSMLKICAASGCDTRTLGEFCIAHESTPASAGSRRAEQPENAPDWSLNTVRSVEHSNAVAVASR
jgi:hypothetical protein